MAASKSRKKSPARAVVGIVAVLAVIYAVHVILTKNAGAGAWDRAVTAYEEKRHDDAVSALTGMAPSVIEAHADIARDYDAFCAEVYFARAEANAQNRARLRDVAEDYGTAGDHCARAKSDTVRVLPFSPSVLYQKALETMAQMVTVNPASVTSDDVAKASGWVEGVKADAKADAATRKTADNLLKILQKPRLNTSKDIES